jgi:hypothetical protein
MTRRNRDEASVGEDSFLDTIANLVGILIILVVIVGAKTKVDAEAFGRGLSKTERLQELEEPLSEAMAIQQALVSQLNSLEEYELENQYRSLERRALLEKVQLAREASKEVMNQLDEKQKTNVEKDHHISQLKSDLEKALQQLGAKEDSARPEIILEHLPTPMARTVFHKELHVMLRQRQIIVIPWERLVETLKQQVPLTAQRQASRGKLEDSLGPLGGFLMKYKMVAVPGGFELDRFELEPTSSVIAEPLETALQENSRFAMELASRNPRETVVTVWVYPDSFDDYRTLKARLYSEGFLCAARPLPEGVRIGASPHGSRSAAQ